MTAARRHTIYGLRVRGTCVVRYVGMTNGPVEDRLDGHLNAAKLRRHNLPLCDWLSHHGEEVEVFKIAYAETRTEAQPLERVIIGLCLKLGQPLLNQRHIPAELKLAA